MLRKGFTLIELVMLLLVLAIVAVVIMTDLSTSVNATRLDAAGWKLKSDIIYAQRLAVTQQVNHGVIFDPSAETYSVYRQTSSTTVNDPLSGAPMTTNYATDSNVKKVGIVVTSISAPTTNQLEFNSFGVPSDGTTVLSSDGTVTLGLGSSTSVVTIIKNTGKVN